MKTLDKFNLNWSLCKQDLVEFKKMLDEKSSLNERDEILPFFRAKRHLAALLGSYHPKIHGFDRLASELNLFGDYTCDLVVGDSQSRSFCFVEFEDAKPNSVFVKKKGKATSEWSPRFEHGFSQILDWFNILEDQRRTPQFRAKFGAEVINYVGLVVAGRRHYLDDAEYQRMQWRSEKVLVEARPVLCLTFDELYQTLSLKLAIYG